MRISLSITQQTQIRWRGHVVHSALSAQCDRGAVVDWTGLQVGPGYWNGVCSLCFINNRTDDDDDWWNLREIITIHWELIIVKSLI